MLTISRTEFQADPAHYIDLVYGGEPIAIQDRGIMIAQIQPPPRPSQADVRQTLAAIRKIREKIDTRGISLNEIRNMIEEGRA